MDLTAVAAALDLTADEAAALKPEWEASQASRPAGPLPFLAPAFVERACETMRFSSPIRDVLRAAAPQIGVDPALLALAWHCRRCFHSSSYPTSAVRHWTSFEGRRRAVGEALYLLVVLAGLPDLLALHHAHDVPERVTCDTLDDVERWLQPHHDEHGVWGLWPQIMGWLRHHFSGDLFHLDRLQFQFGAWQSGFVVYRHAATGMVIALSEDGVRYRADGQIDGAGGVFDPEGGWTASLATSDDTITGHPIRPEGFAVPETMRLRRDEWEVALSPGDPVLHIHIPAGEPMDFDRCGASFREALHFFPKRFPERAWKAFACSSWLLDTQLQDLMPPGSNIARFQREMYLLPSAGSGRSTLERVFGRVPTNFADPQDAPRDTTLRRALVDHVLAGGHIRSGRCVLFPQDLNWGAQVYLRQPLPFA